MAHFLDSLPFDWAHPGAQELRDLLASAYFQQTPVIQLVQAVGMSPADINWNKAMTHVWHELLGVARNRDQLRPLLGKIQADAAFAAFKPRLEELIQDDPIVSAPTRPEPEADAEKPWVGFDDPGELERQIADRPTLLDVSFLAEGLRIAPAVVRLTATFGSGAYHGSGFRISEDTILTNHHVLYDVGHGDEKAGAVEIRFDYERDFSGRPREWTTLEGDPDSIAGDKGDDWAVVRAPEPFPDRYPVLPLGVASQPGVGDRVYIIQHPDGGPKQIGMHHNLVRHVDESVVQYWTDTKYGSSGSPVFDDRWKVVGLHHRWIEKPAPGGRKEYRNQGRRIERVLAGLNDAGVM